MPVVQKRTYVLIGKFTIIEVIWITNSAIRAKAAKNQEIDGGSGRAVPELDRNIIDKLRLVCYIVIAILL
jgi:hypothetical protein